MPPGLHNPWQLITFFTGSCFTIHEETSIAEDLLCAQLRWIDQTSRNTSNQFLKFSEWLEIHANDMTEWRVFNSWREIIIFEVSSIYSYQNWSLRNKQRHIWRQCFVLEVLLATDYYYFLCKVPWLPLILLSVRCICCFCKRDRNCPWPLYPSNQVLCDFIDFIIFCQYWRIVCKHRTNDYILMVWLH